MNPSSNSSSSKPWPTPTTDLQQAIRLRAEEIYERHGRLPGHDLQNWAEAEKEIMQELSERPTPRTAVVINLNGVQYVGEYALESSGGYVPGELAPSTPVSVRFDGEKMFVKRPNGQELETTIVKKIG
jgi:hypothetical protein